MPSRSGEKADASQAIEKALRSALDMEVLRSLPPVSFGLGALYVVFAISHALFLPAFARTQMSVAASASALLLFLLGYEIRRLHLPANWAHPIGASIAGLVLLNSLLHLYLLKEPQQTTNVALLVIGVGCFFLSARWLALAISASICGWIFVQNLSGPSPDWRHFGFMLLAATALSILVHTVRVRTLQQLELMHILNERRREELEEAIEAAQQSEERFRQLSEATFEGVAVHERGRLLNVNRSLAKMFGYSLGKLGEMNALDLVAPESRKLLIEKLLSGSESSFEAQGIRKDGSTFPVEICSKAIPYDERTVVSVMAIRDISERKRIEEEHHRLVREQAARAEAEAANQTKDQFLTTLSHELRTPLAAIIGWAHMLRAGTLDEESTARAIEVIERKAYAQNQLIDDLLDVSRIITNKLSLDMQACDLHAVLASAVDGVRPSASDKSVEIQTAFDADGLSIKGDHNRLQQVMQNLLNNAIKFTPAGGRIEVKLERAGTHARIIVKDTGIGISKEFLPHAFDRFRQADSSTTREHGGLGLGLAIVRHLVDLHSGTVQAFSEGKDEGSTFTVELPLVLEHEAFEREPLSSNGKPIRLANAASSTTLTRLEGVRVLLVDDDADTLAMLGTVLSFNGAEVRLAVDASGALEVLSTWEADVLISDIGMPGQDGYVLIKQIRAAENGRRLPAIALTAYAKEEDRAQALAAGYHLHISKPVEPEDLIAAVSSLQEEG